MNWIFTLNLNFDIVPGASLADIKQLVAAGSLISVLTEAPPETVQLDDQRPEPPDRKKMVHGQRVPRFPEGNLIRLSGNEAELLQHDGTAFCPPLDWTNWQTSARGDLRVDFAAASFWSLLGQAGGRLRPGDMLMVNQAQIAPQPKYLVISLFIPRNIVRSVAGDGLAGRMLAPSGVGAMLKSHMQTTMRQAHLLARAQRTMAVQMAREMALSILQEERQNHADSGALVPGFYQAAKLFITRYCTDPEITPERVANAIGCSRAGLYRAFVKNGESVAAVIWNARLEHASGMLSSPIYVSMLINEIAFRSGFNDISTFNRLFKRTYSAAPGEIRKVS